MFLRQQMFISYLAVNNFKNSEGESLGNVVLSTGSFPGLPQAFFKVVCEHVSYINAVLFLENSMPLQNTIFRHI